MDSGIASQQFFMASDHGMGTPAFIHQIPAFLYILPVERIRD